MPPLSKKRRYAKSAMSLVGREIRSGLFKTLKAATLIVIEDEIENELSTHDMWQAQLHELSDDSSDNEDNVNNIFCDLDRDDNSIDALMNGVLQKEELYDKWKSVGNASNIRGSGNSRATFFRTKKKAVDLRDSTVRTGDIRNFFRFPDVRTPFMISNQQMNMINVFFISPFINL